MLRDSVEIAAYGFAALVAVPCVLYILVRLFRCVGRSPLWRQCRAVILALLAAATIATIKAQKRTGTTGVPPVAGGTTGTTGVSPVANPITNTLYISAIAVSSNDTVTLTAAWPENFLTADQTLDVLGKENLHNETWTWLTNGVITTSATNISWTLDNQSLSNYFYKVVVRDSLTDMDDPDCDGIPNVYELHHGTNPWMPDSSLVPKLTVGTNETYTTIAAAIAESEPYSVIEIAQGEYELSSPVMMPSHPIMVTAAKPYAVIRSTSNLGVFEVNVGQTEETLFRNLYLWLGATSGFQVGFWCGGNLPWDGVPASATFDNVYVRMPNPNVQYRGWIVYRRCAEPVMIRNCTVNAAGATWAIGIDAYGSPPLVIDSCSFLNFPFDGALGCGCGVFLRTSGSSDAGSNVVISRTLFDESFTNAWPFARFDSTNSYFVTVSDCLVPRDLPIEYLPDGSNNITVTNTALTWSGIPYPDSPSVALGIGSLMPIANDPFVDTDGDGCSDYNEAYELGIDPFNMDTDNDGISDGTEIDDETDPANPHSFKQRLTVAVTNKVTLAHVVYTAWGYSETDWETNGLAAFSQGFGDTVYTNASTQGATHIKAFCDLNDNGEYDATYDILLVREISFGATAQVNFAFGDVDGDGVLDAQEREEQTDPYDRGNFRMSVTVKITNDDNVSTITNFLAYGFDAVGWEMNGLASFSYRQSRVFWHSFTTIVTNGNFYVKCYRDLNRNGIYDSDIDPLNVYLIGGGYNGKEYAITIGDCDRDKVVDSVEFAEQTDALNPKNYCFHMTSVVKDIFQTTNRLTVTATFGDSIIYGPIVITGGTWQANFGHLMATNRETIRLDFWDDANENGILEADENKTSLYPAIVGHVTTDHRLLPYGGFDADQNGLLDSWEIQTGLNVIPDRSAYGDTDGDGLTDFLEYVAGTDPLVPDGSNTLLSVMSRSVDDRLTGKSVCDSMDIFIDYAGNGYSHVFEPNTNCWTYGVDLTCCSMWNDNPTLSACGPTQTAVTVISPRHVIYAAHCDYSTTDHPFQNITTNALATMPTNQTYYFRGRSGQIYGRCLTGRKSIGGDIAIGLLDEALPMDDILPAYVLPTNFVDYIHDGKQVPFLIVDQQERATVRSCAGFNLFQVAEFTGSNMPIGDRPCFNKQVFIGGDSGSPKFFLFGNIPVLIGVLHKASGHGSFVSQYITEITRAMDELLPSSGYHLNVLDLSPFETISPYEED